jgi:ComEC/Rec2-related protein
MEKTNLHWKSEHPSIFISLFLIAGICLGKSLHIDKHYVLIVLTLSWVLMIIIHQRSLSPTIKSLYSTMGLVLWGYCIAHLQLNTGNAFIEMTENFIQPIRNSIIVKLNVFIPDTHHNYFARALLIGERTNMDKDTMEVYTALGIIHIIAISGMHIEMISQYLLKLTNWWPKNRWLHFIELIFLMGAICIYTLLAHASPSIVRACIFFCLFQIGNYFHLHKYLLNSIASGLLIILLFNHQTIYHIGWQLSYAAVIGIHLVHPRIQSSISIQNPMIQSLWTNFSITIASQLTTLPLLLFYFGNLSTEQIMYGDLSKEIGGVAKALIAKGVAEKISEKAGDALYKQYQINARLIKAKEDLAIAEKNYNDERSSWDNSAQHFELLREYRNIRDEARNTLQDVRKEWISSVYDFFSTVVSIAIGKNLAKPKTNPRGLIL